MQKIEIILVEDNMLDAKLTIMALKQSNIVNTITHLKDGAEALDFFFGENAEKHLESTQKLILLDLKMPKVNGVEVLQKLKSDERTKVIPVIVFTSSAEDPDVKECYELGVNSYLVKPIELKDFSAAVNNLSLYWVLQNASPS